MVLDLLLHATPCRVRFPSHQLDLFPQVHELLELSAKLIKQLQIREA